MKFTASFLANRDEVILAHLKLFRWWGWQFARRRGNWSDSRDYADAAVSYGVEALGKWTPERGAKFRSFARSYIERSLKREFLGQLRNKTDGQDRSAKIIGKLPASSSESVPIEPDIPDEPELRALNEKTRRVAELSLAGFDMRQIAAQIGIPTKEVAFHIRTATKLVLKYRERMAGPSLFDEVNDALGAEDAETPTTCSR